MDDSFILSYVEYVASSTECTDLSFSRSIVVE